MYLDDTSQYPGVCLPQEIVLTTSQRDPLDHFCLLKNLLVHLDICILLSTFFSRSSRPLRTSSILIYSSASQLCSHTNSSLNEVTPLLKSDPSRVYTDPDLFSAEYSKEF